MDALLEDAITEADPESAVMVLGRGGDFFLMPLDDGAPLPENLAADIATRQFRYCGLLSLVHGQPRVLAEPGGDLFTLAVAGVRWATQLRCRRDDGADWLRALWALPDTRSN